MVGGGCCTLLFHNFYKLSQMIIGIKSTFTSPQIWKEKDRSLVRPALGYCPRIESQLIPPNITKCARNMQGMRGCGVPDHVCVADSIAYNVRAGHAYFMQLPESVSLAAFG